MADQTPDQIIRRLIQDIEDPFTVDEEKPKAERFVAALREHGYAIVYVGDTTGVLPELADLPPEVRLLVQATESMRDHWAEADNARKDELWRTLHQACDAVWGRIDKLSTVEG